MKYPYIVNKNGIWYPAGTEVPEDTIFLNKKENKTSIQYKKSDINRMTTAELKELAKSRGVENAENMTGADLKKVLIELFGL